MLVGLPIGICEDRAAAEVVGMEVEDRLLFEGVVTLRGERGRLSLISICHPPNFFCTKKGL